MGKTLALMLIIIASSVPVSCAAQANPALRAFLSTYMSNSAINGSNYYNQSLGAGRYVLMQANSSGFTGFVIVNVTGGKYSFVMDNSTAFNVVKPFLIGALYPNNTILTGLNSSMRSFVLKSDPPLAMCLFETGLSYHMCTASTPLIQCLESSCESVPICGGAQTTPKSALYQFGVPSPFASGILNFSINYIALNNSYNRYFSLLSDMNPSNYTSNINGMRAALANITSITSVILEDPIFPTPTNITTTEQMSVCPNYAARLNGPWWCYSIGYCDGTTFNYTALSGISGQLDAMQYLPVSYSAMDSVAANSTALAYGYINKITNAQKTAAFNRFIASILPAYNSTVTNAVALAGRLKEPSLSYALQKLESTFSSIDALGINQNITRANIILSSALANLSSVYSRFNVLYASVFGMASNNTNRILIKELSFKSVPASLASLAGREQLVNVRLNSGINVSTANALLVELKSINSGLGYVLTPLSLASAVKSLDGGFVSSLLSGSSAPIAAKLSGGALYATALSLMVSIVLFALFYLLVYHRLGRKHRIKLNRRTKRAWRSLFLVMLALAAVYLALTYVYASSAIGFLPLGSFISALKGSTNVFIAYNSSANSSVVACAASLRSMLQALGKNVQTITLRNYSCVSSSNSTLAGTECMSRLIASMQPTVLMGQGANSSIVYRGMYGTVLHATGSLASGTSCTLDSVLKYK